MLDDHEHVKRPKGCRHRDDKIARNDRFASFIKMWTSADRRVAAPEGASACIPPRHEVSRAILRIGMRSSAGIGGHPARNFNRQKIRQRAGASALGSTAGRSPPSRANQIAC